MRKLNHGEITLQRKSIQDMKSCERFPLVLVCHNIRSALNLGSIFRTADSSAIEKIYLSGYTARPPHKEILKTALGATETVNWEYLKTAEEVLGRLIADNYAILALEQSNMSFNIFDYPFIQKKTAIILGNEIFGVDDLFLAKAEACLEIPMFGMKHSLNVAVAAGIAVYAYLNKREFKIEY